jgi:hypothetical protein
MDVAKTIGVGVQLVGLGALIGTRWLGKALPPAARVALTAGGGLLLLAGSLVVAGAIRLW